MISTSMTFEATTNFNTFFVNLFNGTLSEKS